MAGSGFILSSFAPGGGGGGGGGAGVADIYSTAGDPTADHDSVDTAGVGQTFEEGDVWHNSSTGVLWVCRDDTATAAVWSISVVTGTGPSTDNALARYDGTTGQVLQNSNAILSDAGALSLVDSLSLVSTAIDEAPSEAKGLVLRNPTTATAGTDQWSPSIYLAGQAYKTAPGPTGSREMIFRIENRTVAGVLGAAFLAFSWSHNGGAYADLAYMDSSGITVEGSRSFHSLNGHLGPTSLGIDGALDLKQSKSEDKALVLRNSTAATAGELRQNSPSIYMAGSGWNTTGVESEAVVIRLHMEPGAGDPTDGRIRIDQSIAGGAYETKIQLLGSGGIYLQSKEIAETPTTTKGIYLQNESAAIDGLQQWSPSIYFFGYAWETTVGSSDFVTFRMENQTVQGANASGKFTIGAGINTFTTTDLFQFTSDGDFFWAADGGGDIGAIGANRPANVHASTLVSAPTVSAVNVSATGDVTSSAGYLASSNARIYGGQAFGVGIGVTDTFYTQGSNELAILNRGRPDAASTRVVTTVWDTSAASITNAETMRIHSFGWADVGDVYNELAYFTCAGGAALLPLAIATTPSEGKSLVLRNSTAATVGSQYQFSPSIYFASQGWTGSSVETIARLTGISYGADGALDVEFNSGGGSFAVTHEFGGAGRLSLMPTAIGTTPTEAKSLVLRNSTAAAAGAQQWSPSIYLAGQGWETTGGSSDEVVWRITGESYQGAAAGGKLVYAHSVDGAAYSDVFSLNTSGAVECNNDLYVQGYTGGITLQTSGAHNGGLAYWSSGDREIVLSNVLRVDAAAARVVTTSYYPNATSISNLDMRIHSFGWVSSTGPTYNELAYISAGGGLTLLPTEIAATPSEDKSLVLRNATAAAAGAQQYSPSIYLAGQGWKTDATAESQECAWQITNIPAQGAAAPSTSLQFLYSVDGAAYTAALSIGQGGTSVNGTLASTSTLWNAGVDNTGSVGWSASTGRWAHAYLGTSVNVANSAAVLDATSLEITGAMAIGATPTEAEGLVLRNSSDAADGAQQLSPHIYLAGRGWETTTSSSDEVIFRMGVTPVQGASVSGAFLIDASLNGGAYANAFSLNNAGVIGCTQIWCNGHYDSTTSVYQYADHSEGLGAVPKLYNYGLDKEFALVNANRGDSADNRVFTVLYDRNAASITNAATMRITSFGWTNNSDTYAELASVRADGAIIGNELRAAGDLSGLASHTSLTNVVNAPDDTPAVLGNYHVNGSAGVFHGWVKMYDGTQAVYVPCWKDA
jgi:hypothetical protein